MAMNEERLFDHSLWLSMASKQSNVLDNPEGAAHMVERFVAQYVPAILKTRTNPDYERVWLAFWHYLVAPRTSRKPFGLSSEAADELIAEFQTELPRPGEA